MKVFVSYSRDSEASARALVSDLESLGHEVWFDRELSGGQAWWAQILAAIRDCGLFVFLLHPRSLESVACTRERGYALALGKTVLPLQVADGISVNLLPPDLARCQIIPYRSGDRAEVLALARAVAAVPPPPPLPEPLPPPPELPASYLGALAARIDGDAVLRFEDQSALLVDLRQALRDPASRADAEVLLGRLRRRRDLLAAIAAEIDAMQAPGPVPAAPARPAPAPAASPAPPEAAPPAGARPAAAGLHWAWVFGPAGALAGLVTGLVGVRNVSGGFSEVLAVAGILAAVGLLAGAIAGRDRRSAALAAAGAVLGAAMLLLLVSDRAALLIAMVWGFGPGAVVGAGAGRLWRRLRPH